MNAQLAIVCDPNRFSARLQHRFVKRPHPAHPYHCAWLVGDRMFDMNWLFREIPADHYAGRTVFVFEAPAAISIDYLRGMVGVGSTETGDEPLYLRGRDENGAPQPVWGAIVDTYRNQTTGQVLSCAKFLYLMPGDGRGDVRRQYVVWGKPVDPRRMDQYRDAPFTPAQLKATYPDCLTFPSAEAFHTHIWSAMGLSEAACRLLHKIQSADAPSRLDDIFKQGVLGVPEALDLARTTVEDYERYDENFHAMDEKTRRMDTLRGIQQAYGEYAAARGKARAFEPVKPAVDGTVPAVLRDWALARMRGEVAVQLPADRAEQQNSEAEAKLLRRRTEDLRTRLDMIRGQMQGLDGGNLTRLELELDQARRTLEDVQANRTRIEQTFASIGETLPGDEQAWNERRINAVNFKREYNKRDGECEEALTAAINARAGARGDLERLQRDFDRQRSQRTRISQQMDETRAMLEALTKGDEVVTQGGVIGKITKLGDAFVSIEVANGVELQLQRAAIIQVLPKGTYK